MKKSLFSFFILAFLFVGGFAGAEKTGDTLNLLKNTAGLAGYSAATNEYSLAETMGNVIYIFLSLLGVIFLVLTVYAGYLWLTAGGDERKIDDAKSYLKSAVIGMLIVLASFGITKFVVGSLVQSGTVEQNNTAPSP